MLSVEQAVGIARQNFVTMFPDSDNIQVEELEISDDDKYIFVTIGYVSEGPSLVNPRKYKQFKIDRNTGEVRAIRIRIPERV